MARFRVREILAESWRNLISRPILTLFTILAVMSISFGVVYSSATAAREISRIDDSQRARGATVLVVYAENREAWSSQSCDSLATIPGVIASGARLSNESFQILVAPGRTVWVERVTPGFSRIVWPDLSPERLSGGGVIAGASIAKEFGLVPSASLSVQGIGGTTTVTILATPRGSERFPILDERVVELQAPGTESTAVECFLELEVTGGISRQRVESAILASLPAQPGFFTVPFVQPIPEAETAASLLRSSPVKYVGAAGAVALLLSISMNWYVRRKDIALLKVLGATRGQLLILSSCDMVLLGFGPMLLSASVAASVTCSGKVSALVAQSLLLQTGLLLSTSLLAPLLMLVVAPTRTALAILKD